MNLPNKPTENPDLPTEESPEIPLTTEEAEQRLREEERDVTERPRKKRKNFWKALGPGLITGAADDDPSGIGTYSVAGAQFGYGLLWLVPFCIPLMIAVQEMCGRVGAITGKGLAAILKEYYPRWILLGSVVLLIGANVINIWADLNVMAASMKMLFGLPFAFWLTIVTAATLLLIVLIPYRLYVHYLKWACLALLSYVVTALLPALHPNWGQVARHLFVPSWQHSSGYIMTLVGFLGTTISPYLFFWQADETVEEEIVTGSATEPGKRIRKVTEPELHAMRTDTVIGMAGSQIITFFIMVCTASTLHVHGKTDINTAQDAAEALRPLGQSAYWLFTLGIIGTGMLAIPTLAGSAAYAVAETVGWRYGLYRRYARAHGFYGAIAICILVGYLLNFIHSFSPIKGLLYTAVLNGVVAPPLIVLLLLICNNRKIVGERTNGWASNILGWLTVVLMSAAAIYMFYAMATGKAS